ncbi:AF4/FMR2 family member lilli [Drosophila innubila]|uniref:AF4/FMR2 family member lilli n=1 Tax=Drosophila innubila TaxID=198719 RepID=UPI00148E4B07|nr:AF4/FMR2 family member lilli [Drosophila innubila]
MAEAANIKSDAQQQQKMTAALKGETNIVAAEEEEEEAEKAGASESKHEEVKKEEVKDKSIMDKLDELSSLEQEIAKMHNIQSEQVELKTPTNEAGGNNNNENGNGKNDAQSMDELPKRCTPDNKLHAKEETEAVATLEEVDLIALLKGTDQEQEQEQQQKKQQELESEPKSSIEMALAELDNVGVTIEGEGQYEIMEIDDEDNASAASPVLQTAASSKVGSKSQGKLKLSPEQARAVALKQMADLKGETARRKEAAARQQQQQQQQQPMDIISTLNDDWNEYDSGSDNTCNSNSNAIATTANKKKSKAATDSPATGSVKLLNKSVTSKPAAEPVSINAEPMGFKRTRVIKRKIIWDPDVPETQKSFAQYASAKGTTTPTTTTASPTPAATATTATTTTTAAAKANISNVETPKRTRPATPKETHKAAAKRAATPSKLVESNAAANVAANDAAATPKRRSQTPSVPNGAKKKKISEIDRLMGDEGAANMMQAVEREQRELSGGELQLQNKPLMRKRSLTITGRQLQKPATIAADVLQPTPRKESPPKGNKRAATPAINNNNNNSNAAVDAVFTKAKKSQAADSWDYVYKQRASEESMIMRRRSNSSYSSNASVSRLSLDTKPAAVANLSDDASDVPANDPSFKFLKPETKANQRSDGATQQTLANDLKHGGAQQQQKESRVATTAVAKTELVTLHKLEKVSQLIINTQLSKMGHTYKLQLLQKLTEMLNKLAKSNDCNTVLLSVQGSQFCEGIDCQELIAPTLEKRKSSASQFSLVLKTYLRTLFTFPKPLVAGIVGNLMNLGVMQLPLLDYVVAAEDCSFEASYAKLGQLPEGYALWHKHPKVTSQVHTRLFLLGERLHTSELVEFPIGFIDKSCKARSVNDEALAAAKIISSNTAEHYRALKKLNHTANTANLQRLEAEFKILTEQWSSANFQANYKRYVSDLNI